MEKRLLSPPIFQKIGGLRDRPDPGMLPVGEAQKFKNHKNTR